MKTTKPSVNKKQLAYDYIRSQIVNGVFGSGYRIVIDQIAKELKLSIIPVREAIRQLEADGLIQYKPYSGAIVSKINEEEYMETLAVLAVLEGYATSLSANRMNPDDIRLLEQINHSMSDALYEFEFEQFSELNRKFHDVLIDNCENKYLKEQIRDCWDRLGRVRKSGFPFMPKRAKESIKEHEQMIAMIKEQNLDEQFVRQHKLNTVKAFKERTDSDIVLDT
ncbi:GntR family transcriptional regulator [Paenibacillus melissococcoides]|uniref:GntR family transcriptional regulator n=1 Tax=Paenibacillus melissococcoides TaxID=2912268 RepID=A0ABM9G2L5_9BACL|nr:MULTISPECIES: GntR family transcriptional regulator [Paenibacillus]MEB9892236.1 GntR family transcriptional regulator [Bacillus cereus]CAH8245887.1 GntR family transcriptional regulator [Paenibacillus melissococcoides]CAH8712369.1 GntR family transcriptional regulator [Paenibacillus melissococcoides]CAH8713116.1 GntR family transcriptional regulator [Paenibacillus melissococcoides]